MKAIAIQFIVHLILFTALIIGLIFAIVLFVQNHKRIDDTLKRINQDKAFRRQFSCILRDMDYQTCIDRK